MSTEPENTNLRTDYYDFDLPKSLIAQEPLPNREDARLLMVDREKSAIDHAHVRDLHNMLRPGDCLVLNDTKVVPAQLTGLREQTGGRWQGLFLEADEQGNWRMLAKTRGKIQAGEKVVLEDRHGVPRNKLVLLSKMENGQWIGRPEPEDDGSRLGQRSVFSVAASRQNSVTALHSWRQDGRRRYPELSDDFCQAPGSGRGSDGRFAPY